MLKPKPPTPLEHRPILTSQSASKKFKHRPIVEPDGIRLAHLHPALDLSAQVECSLEHATLSHYSQDLVDQYTALSYVWGSATDTRTIIVDGCSVDVTANLESALRHIRDKDRILRIWADAICINQDDVTERNHQVQQMGSVYSVALHTVIYLGPSDAEACAVFEELQYLSRRVRLFEADLDRLPSKESLRKLHDALESHILNHSWFTRVWIFQELMMSQNPWVVCGNQRLKWDTFCALSSMIRDKVRSPIGTADQVEALEDLAGKITGAARADQDANLKPGKGAMGLLSAMHATRQKFQHHVKNNGPGNSLLDLLRLRRGLGVSETSDMIYAHIGLASDFTLNDVGFKVDYSKTAPQVFADVAQYFVEKYGDYRIFDYIEDVDPQKRYAGLPSWAPNWTSTKHHNTNDKLHIVSDHRAPVFLFSASKKGKRLLTCSGEIMGRIGHVGNIIDDVIPVHLLNPIESKIAWSAYVAVSYGELSRFPWSSERGWWQEEGQAYEMFLRDWSRAMAIQSDKILEITLFYFNHRATLDGLQTTLRNAKYNQKNMAMRLHPIALMSALLFQRSSSLKDLHFIEDGKVPLIEGRRICLMEDEEHRKPWWRDGVVLVPQSAREGDMICKLVGDSRAFVFRRVQGSELCNDGSECFTVIGSCSISQGFRYWDSRGESTFVLC